MGIGDPSRRSHVAKPGLPTRAVARTRETGFGFQGCPHWKWVCKTTNLEGNIFCLSSITYRNSPYWCRQQVQRISTQRERFWALRCGGRLTAQPAQPPKTTEKSGRSRIGRTGSLWQMAEGTGLRSNLLWILEPAIWLLSRKIRRALRPDR